MKVEAEGRTAAGSPPEAASQEAGRRADRLLEVGVTIAIATVAAQSAAHLLGVLALDDRFLHLNADDEHGLPAWLGASATFAAAFGVLMLALLRETIDRKLIALAGLLAFFSLDDAVAIHERIGEKVAGALGYGDIAERLAWPAVFLPLFFAGLVLLVYVGRQLPARLERLLQWGVGLLALALAAETVSSALYAFLDVERGSWPDSVEVVIEEGAELGAWMLIATALLAGVLGILDEDRADGRRKLPA